MMAMRLHSYKGRLCEGGNIHLQLENRFEAIAQKLSVRHYRVECTMAQVYAAILDAMVGGTKKGPAFSCELIGEGVLPSLSVEVPASKGQSEPKQIVFPRTLVVRP
jgi:hypothetical protein